jgi:cyclase
MTVRVIPRLEIKGPNLVKGIHLEGLRTLGSPESFAQHYYQHGADELIYMDTVASLYSRNNILGLVKKTAEEIFIPLTVGGGLRSIDDIREALRAGADKVAINTAAVNNPDLIREASEEFGSSTIVVSIEAIEQADGTYQAFCENGREPTGRDAVEWANEAAEMGAGEILLTSVDREGRGEGYDIDLTSEVADAVDIPVIACGGAGSPDHVSEAVTEGHADAVSMSSILHYRLGRKRREEEIEKVSQRDEGNLHWLKKGTPPGFIDTTELPDLKEHLRNAGVDVRRVEGTYV